MKISNRFLLMVAGLSAVAVVALTMKSPLTKTVNVLRAKQSMNAGSEIALGVNAEGAPVSVASFGALGSGGHLIPASMVPLLGRVTLVRPKESGAYIRTDDIADIVNRTSAGGGGETSYVRMSGQFSPAESAVGLNVNELGSFAYSLEPDDQIEIVLPASSDQRGGGVPFLARVLAVGSRTANGWTTAARRREEFSTITLLFPSVAEGRRFAEVFAMAPSVRPMIILLSSRR